MSHDWKRILGAPLLVVVGLSLIVDWRAEEGGIASFLFMIGVVCLVFGGYIAATMRRHHLRSASAVHNQK